VFILMLSTVVPIYLISYATEYWHFLVLGLFVGLAGGSFSVGTPYVARWFKPERKGLAMGCSVPVTPVQPSINSLRRSLSPALAG
jgi:NNP family nitrate/nitrite transporter-like MFS transporter